MKFFAFAAIFIPLAVKSSQVLPDTFEISALSHGFQTESTVNVTALPVSQCTSISMSVGKIFAGSSSNSYQDDSLGSGAVHFYSQSGTQNKWALRGTLLPPKSVSYFGASVASIDNYFVVGAFSMNSEAMPGGAYLYTFITSTTWSPVAVLTGSASYNELFGYSLALAPGLVIVGAPGVLGSSTVVGGAYVFVQGSSSSGTATWTQRALLMGSQSNGLFGESVSILGTQALVGAPVDGSGKAYVYSGANSQWTLTATLIGDGGAGSSFGCDVSLDRSGASPFALVGASGDTTSTQAGYYGAVYVFVASSLGGASGWSVQAKLVGSTDQKGSFGSVVRVSGYTAAISAPGHMGTGAVFTYASFNGAWSLSAVLMGPGHGSDFGIGLSLVGGWAAIVSPNNFIYYQEESVAVASLAGVGPPVPSYRPTSRPTTNVQGPSKPPSPRPTFRPSRIPTSRPTYATPKPTYTRAPTPTPHPTRSPTAARTYLSGGLRGLIIVIVCVFCGMFMFLLFLKLVAWWLGEPSLAAWIVRLWDRTVIPHHIAEEKGDEMPNLAVDTAYFIGSLICRILHCCGASSRSGADDSEGGHEKASSPIGVAPEEVDDEGEYLDEESKSNVLMAKLDQALCDDLDDGVDYVL